MNTAARVLGGAKASEDTVLVPSGAAASHPAASRVNQGRSKLERARPGAEPAFAVRLDAALRAAMAPGDEAPGDPDWSKASAGLSALVLASGKRVRPALVAIGYRLARAEAQAERDGGHGSDDGVPDEVIRFAAALELLHVFMLVHDDVADRSETRRGLPALHVGLAPRASDAAPRDGARLGEQLAVVAGDHLFARATEEMLACAQPGALRGARLMLAVCRQTAVGQYLDLSLSTRPLAQVSLFDTLRVATLKTARYGFVAPLACGAILGGGSEELEATLARAGRHAGLAFQLRDDVLGLLGAAELTGKPAAGDYFEGKRTFPLVAAWTRAEAAQRQALEDLWTREPKDAGAAALAVEAVRAAGGFDATERVIARATRAAQRALAHLAPSTALAELQGLVWSLATRRA